MHCHSRKQAVLLYTVPAGFSTVLGTSSPNTHPLSPTWPGALLTAQGRSVSAADKDSCPHMLEDKLYGKKNAEGVEQVKQELKMPWGGVQQAAV